MARLTHHPSFLWVFVPGFYALLLAGCSWYFVPPGISHAFLSALIPILAAMMGVALLVGVFNSASAEGRTSAVWSWADLILVLLPLGPIAGYVYLNRAILSTADITTILLGLFVLLSLVIVVLPRLLSGLGSYAALAGMATGLAYTLSVMPLLSATFQWNDTGQLGVQLGVFIFTSALVTLLFHKERQILYGVAVLVLVGSLFQAPATPPPTREIGQTKDVYNGQPSRRPSIYLLTYDGYVINQTMLAYGIDNSDQEQWLKAEGFRIFPETYSVAGSSNATMGRVLGETIDSRHATSGNSPLVRQLRKAGYTSYGVFWSGYFFRGSGAQYDVYFPAEGHSALTLTLAIFEGRFRHNAAYQDPPYARFITEKRKRLAESPGTPKFIYTHTGPGHSQNSGRCLADETERFKQRLVIANKEMKEDVKTIRAADPDAIIIINGDHGPYLTLTCHHLTDTPHEQIGRLDLQDRYGTFLAVTGPDEFVRNLEPTILQDITPAVLNYLYPEESFDEYRIRPDTTIQHNVTGGVSISNGIIVGGRDNGKTLFAPAAYSGDLSADSLE
ncbi:MAG: hypothetical protein AAF993_17040 [Pseudomonadota bacterium]